MYFFFFLNCFRKTFERTFKQHTRRKHIFSNVYNSFLIRTLYRVLYRLNFAYADANYGHVTRRLDVQFPTFDRVSRALSTRTRDNRPRTFEQRASRRVFDVSLVNIIARFT